MSVSNQRSTIRFEEADDSINISAKIDGELNNCLESAATVTNQSKSEIVRSACKQYLGIDD